MQKDSLPELHKKIVNTLEQLAVLGELHGLNPFKIKAYQNAARILKSPEDLKRLLPTSRPQKIVGIGAGILTIIEEILAHEQSSELAELLLTTPSGLLDILQLSDIGPKRARLLWKELGITSISQLEYACHENLLREVKGFGVKREKSILAALQFYLHQQGLFRMDEAFGAYKLFSQELTALPDFIKLALVGDLRRGCETVARVEVLALFHPSSLAVADFLLALQNLFDASVVREPSSYPGLDQFLISTKTAPVRLFCCTLLASFGWHKLVLTGSERFVQAVLKQAKHKGYQNAQGILTKGNKQVQMPYEEDCFKELDLDFVVPEQRENFVSLTGAQKLSKKLVCRADLQGAFHNHTHASDGAHSLEEMRHAAICQGLRYISLNDHSQSAVYAKGLTDLALFSQKEKINTLNQDSQGKQCWLLTGVESDILAQGQLDYPGETLSQLDVVIGSVHSRLKQDAAAMTARLVQAALNPYLAIVGHPTGRLVLGRPPSEFDMEAFLKACKQSGCAVELNANPHRLDLNEQHLALAKELGVLVAINADAHSMEGLLDLDYGITIARRAGLTPYDILNCRPLPNIVDWLKDRKSLVSSE